MSFERGAPVAWGGGRGLVLMDVGEPTVVVRRVDGVSFRVAREELQPDASQVPELWGFVVDVRFCALQRQAHPPTKAEMVEGAWTLCGKWVSSRSSPTRGTVTCTVCAARATEAKS